MHKNMFLNLSITRVAQKMKTLDLLTSEIIHQFIKRAYAQEHNPSITRRSLFNKRVRWHPGEDEPNTTR